MKLSQFKHIGTYTKVKGILISYKPNVVKIKDLQIIQTGQLVSFKAKLNNDWVNFTTMYAPSDEDNPHFMLKAKAEFDKLDGDLGLICGDYNTTLDAKYDRFGYTSDTHRKCRSAILNWIDTGELIDVVRGFKPDTYLILGEQRTTSKKAGSTTFLLPQNFHPLLVKQDMSFMNMS